VRREEKKKRKQHLDYLNTLYLGRGKEKEKRSPRKEGKKKGMRSPYILLLTEEEKKEKKGRRTVVPKGKEPREREEGRRQTTPGERKGNYVCLFYYGRNMKGEEKPAISEGRKRGGKKSRLHFHQRREKGGRGLVAGRKKEVVVAVAEAFNGLRPLPKRGKGRRKSQYLCLDRGREKKLRRDGKEKNET